MQLKLVRKTVSWLLATAHASIRTAESSLYQLSVKIARFPLSTHIVRHETVSVALSFALVLAIIYPSVVFGGKTLIPTSYYPHGLTEKQELQGREAVNSFNVDLATPAYYEFPINRLVGDMYRQGHMPLWNPYQASGTPLAAQYSTRAFFPYQILENLSPYWSWDYFLLGRLWIAGLFTFLLLRALALRLSSAFLGGLFFMLSGALVWFINLEQMTNVAMLIPVLLLSLEKMIGTRRRRHFLFTVISFGLVLVAGQPETAAYVMLLAGLYVIWRTWTLRRLTWDRLRGVFQAFFALFLGMGLAAPLIIPFLEFVIVGHNIHPAGGAMGVLSVPVPAWGIGVFLPTFFEVPTWERAGPINGVWDFLGGYSGVLPAGLMFLALAVGLRGMRYRFHLLFFGAIGTTILLKNFGVVPFVWLGHLPVLDMVWSPRWAGPIWSFCFAVAGAFAFEMLTSGSRKGAELVKDTGVIQGLPADTPPEGSPRNAGKLLGMLPGFQWIPLGAILLAVVIVVNFPEVLRDNNPLTPFISWSENLPYLISSVLLGGLGSAMILGTTLWIFRCRESWGRWPAAVILLAIVELWFLIPRGYDAPFLALKLIPLAAGVMAAISLARGRTAWTAVMASLAVLSIVSLDFMSPRGFPDRQDPFISKPYVEFIKEDPGLYRVMGTNGALMPNFAGAVGLHDVRFVNSMVVRPYNEFSKRLTGYPMSQVDSGSLQFTGLSKVVPELPALPNVYSWATFPMREAFIHQLPFYSLLSVKYLVTPQTNEFLYTDGFGDWVPTALPNWTSGFDSGAGASFTKDSLVMGSWKSVDGHLGVFSDTPQDLIYKFSFGNPIKSGLMHVWFNIQEPGGAVSAYLSSDGKEWGSPLATLQGVNPTYIQRVAFPTSLLGQTSLYVKFTGRSPSNSDLVALEQWGIWVESQGKNAPYNYTIHGSEPQELQPLSALPLVYDGEVRVYENPEAIPRFFIAHNVQQVAHAEDGWNALEQGLVDGHNTIIVEEHVPGLRNNTSAPPNTQDSVTLVEYQPNKVILKAVTDAPGMLVLNDVAYDGWSAWVDNQRTKIYRVNGLVRGVFIESGEHQVVFQYNPNSFVAGVIMALVAAISTVTWAMMPRREAQPLNSESSKAQNG